MSTVRERLVEAHKEFPDYTQADLARYLGVSRERVRQVSNNLGLTLVRGHRSIEERVTELNKKFPNYTQADLARAVEVTPSYMSYLARRLGLALVDGRTLKESYVYEQSVSRKCGCGRRIRKQFSTKCYKCVRETIFRKCKCGRRIRRQFSIMCYKCRRTISRKCECGRVLKRREWDKCYWCRLKEGKSSLVTVERQCSICGTTFILRKSSTLANEVRHNTTRHYCKLCRRTKRKLYHYKRVCKLCGSSITGNKYCILCYRTKVLNRR